MLATPVSDPSSVLAAANEDVSKPPESEDLIPTSEIEDGGVGDDRDFDSAYGRSSPCSTTTLSSSILNHVYESGRRYPCKGEYYLPNDEIEQERLDMQHHIAKLILGGRLCCAPIPTNSQRVLDMGTGTGIWAIDFADEYASAEVIGLDLSPIQPSWVPPNCSFLIDNLEDFWILGHPFDFIHGRALGGSIADWGKLYQQAYDNLKEGGWIEMQEYECRIYSFEDPGWEKVPAIHQWQTLLDKATTQIGKKLDVASHQREFLEAEGFRSTKDQLYEVPCGTWAKGQKELETWQLVHMIDSLEPYTLASFTRTLGWTEPETRVLIAQVKRELLDKNNRLYLKLHFVYGRK